MSEQSKTWIWIPLGLALGLFIAFLMFLDGKKQATTVVEEPVEVPQKSRSEPVFDFYTVLPDRVVEVEPSEPVTQGTTDKPIKADKQQYLLQVGSFNNFSDADQLKAQLAFLGLQAKLATVKVKESTWYRVQLGPFNSDGVLSKTKNLLIQNNIKYLQKKAS